MRDQSDPSAVGRLYLMNRALNLPLAQAVTSAVELAVDFDAEHQGPIEKYGRPGDHPARFELIQVA